MNAAGYLYFAQAGEDGPVKIGSSRNPIRRIHALRKVFNSELSLLAAFPRTHAADDELQTHRKLASARISQRGIGREWYSPAAALVELQRLKDGGAIPTMSPRKVTRTAVRHTPEQMRQWLNAAIRDSRELQDWIRLTLDKAAQTT